MFVANHNSWMDIPFVCMTIGWKTNHKVIAKAELSKVPILGKAIDLGGHVKVDRGNRRSQVTTLKAGMKWLKVRTSFLFEKIEPKNVVSFKCANCQFIGFN